MPSGRCVKITSIGHLRESTAASEASLLGCLSDLELASLWVAEGCPGRSHPVLAEFTRRMWARAEEAAQGARGLSIPPPWRTLDQRV